jgi:hypothetical protein
MEWTKAKERGCEQASPHGAREGVERPEEEQAVRDVEREIGGVVSEGIQPE